MAIPFLHYFKRGKTEKTPKAEAAPPPPRLPIEKPSSERFSKTVMPSATRNGSPQTPKAASPMPAPAPMPAGVAARKISFEGSPAPAPRTDLPPAVAFALEPKVERVISLELGDILPHLPVDYVKEIATLDTSSPVLLKAAEVEKGMASGRPTISLASIHEQAPEIFAREVPPGDKTQVPLPFSKVLDEFTKLQVRADQVRQAAVPQVETPFLKVTLEDNERFGVTQEELETGDLPPVKVDPPTAESFAAAEPEPAMEARAYLAAPATMPIPFSITPPPAQPSKPAVEAAPARIPFKISPNGTDVPANESVPASGGPSVSNSSPAAPATTPKRIPFKIAPPVPDNAEAQPKTEPWLTAENFGVAPRAPKSQAPKSDTAAKAETKIRLGLKSVLESLPEFQRTADASSVPADVRMELPFAIVQPQLASGRISIAPAVFAAAMPESFRGLFAADCAEDVVLPLQEVLKNLPAASLRMRDDQVEQEVGANFETPFSTKAEEDAKRFNVAAKPIEKPAAEEQPAVEKEEQTPADERRAANGDSLRTPLQVALGTDEKLDAKGVVSHINRLPGVKASSILFCDGLNLAGNLPAELEADGLCAMAPGLIQRIESHMGDTKLGALRGMTLACSKGTMTFFVHENLCLAALHSNGEIAPEVRERLSRVVHEMSRKYSHPV